MSTYRRVLVFIEEEETRKGEAVLSELKECVLIFAMRHSKNFFEVSERHTQLSVGIKIIQKSD